MASVRVERSGPGGVVANVILAKPDVHNAFDATMIAELRAAFGALATEGAAQLRAVVLSGDGPSFCAGADVAWMRAAMSLDREANEQDAMAMAEMFDTIDSCPAPVVARVHGSALGGGMGLCAVSDLVVAESGTRFGFTETRLGILPSVISPFVIAKIGETHARALFPGGRRFDAIRAQRIGLVHEVVEGETALDAAVGVAVADLLAAGPTAARAAKSIVREVRGLPHGSSKWHTARVIAGQRQTAGGAGGVPGLHRETTAGVGARRGCLTPLPTVPTSGLVACVGCRGLVPDEDGPIHRYITASPGCWRIYTELGASGLPAVPKSTLAVDAYAVTHPGVPGRQSTPSVWIHLVTLCCALERGWSLDGAIQLRRVTADAFDVWPWLDRPVGMGPITVVDVAGASADGDAARAGLLVEGWIHGAWDAWSQHHPAVRARADDIVGRFFS